MSPQLRGCKTCQARKVRCDRTVPHCVRCARAGRSCGGYQVPLSWPKGDNHRRAITVSLPTFVNKARKYDFVHSTVWDMELYHGLAEGWTVAEKARCALKDFFTPPLNWMPYQLGDTDKQLMQYFESTAFRSLDTFGVDPLALRDIILRMTLSSNTPAAQALLQSLLALSSLHRRGPHTQALQHKVAALKRLSDSVDYGVDGKEAFQHGAAGMLLCSFEAQQQAEGCQNWTWYICGSKRIISQAIQKKPSLIDDDSTILLGWVHSYDVLAKFSSRHWQWRGPRSVDNDLGISDASLKHQTAFSIPYPNSPSHEVLSLMASVVETVVSPASPQYHTDQYWTRIETLKWKLQEVAPVEEGSTDLDHTNFDVTRLYQLAAQIYLERALIDRQTQSEKIKLWLDEAFDILGGLRTCPWPLPLFVIGCEAQTDERRLIIMNLIYRTETDTIVKHLGCLKNLLRVSWTQDDLAQRNTSYIERLDSIMSLSDTAPILL